MTDRRSPTGFVHWRSPSSSQAATVTDSPRSPRINGGRFSSRRNQTRWSSQELPSRSVEVEERSQSRRTGSGDSMLAASSNRGIERSFRAAGLTWKREETADDVFWSRERSSPSIEWGAQWPCGVVKTWNSFKQQNVDVCGSRARQDSRQD